MGNPSVDKLREAFDYSPETGVLTRRRTTSHNAREGDEVGCFTDEGYRHVRIESKLYKVHRVIWAYVHGEWPDNQIDHINGDRADNRIANLRQATQAENAKNQKILSANTSGVRGVSWHKRDCVWHAYISFENKRRHIGSFETIEEAKMARLAAENSLHGKFGASSSRNEYPAIGEAM